MKQYAYIRVSSKDQSVDCQIMALEPYNIPEKQIFCDYQSGKDFERPAYNKMLKKLKENDLLIIKSIDRLGRNYSDILVQWQYITKEVKADILVLDMDLLDTRKKDGDLTGTLIADLVLQIFAYVAQTEREFIHQRQAEGIEVAKRNGVIFGRRPKQMPDGFIELCEKCKNGDKSIREAAAELGVASSTFYRHYCNICIVDIETQKPLERNQEGRILERSNSAFLSYYGLEEETEKAWVVLEDGTRWFDTKDIGFLDEDGFLHVSGRLSRVVIRTDYKVSLDFIENKFRCCPLVDDCGVIATNNPVLDVIGFVKVNKEAKGIYEAENKLMEHIQCSENPFSMLDKPAKIFIVDSIPYLSSNKIDYKALEALFIKENS